MPDHYISDTLECPTCEKPMPAAAAVCAHCGKTKKAPDHSSKRDAKQATFVKLLDQRRMEHQALRAKAQSRHRYGLTGAAIVLLLLVTGVFSRLLPGGSLVLVIGLALFAACLVYANSGGVTKAQYEALAAIDSRNGKPRCLYCGHTGIYRHTPYKSSQTLNDCAGCQEHLYITGAKRRY